MRAALAGRLLAHPTNGAARRGPVRWGNRWFGYTLAGGAAATFTWTGTEHGTADPAAIGSVDIPFVNPDGTRALVSVDSGQLAAETQVRVGGQRLGYTLPTGASLTPPTTEVTLPRSGWTVSAASDPGEPASNAIDGDPATRWSTGHSRPLRSDVRRAVGRHHQHLPVAGGRGGDLHDPPGVDLYRADIRVAAARTYAG